MTAGLTEQQQQEHELVIARNQAMQQAAQEAAAKGISAEEHARQSGYKDYAVGAGGNVTLGDPDNPNAPIPRVVSAPAPTAEPEETITVGLQIGQQYQERIKKSDYEAVKRENPNLARTLLEKGLVAYNSSVRQENRIREAEAVESDIKDIPEEDKKALRKAYNEGGIKRYKEAVSEYNAKVEKEAQQKKPEHKAEPEKRKPEEGTPAMATLEKLAREQAKGSKLTASSDRVTVPATGKEAKGLIEQGIRREETARRLTNVYEKVLQGSIITSEIIVPGLYTAKYWDELSPAEKSFNIAIDAVTFLLPVVKAGAIGARVVGTAGRVARFEGALKGAALEGVRASIAPVDMIAHPLETVKGSARSVRELAENIANPRKIPQAVITTSEGTVRLKVNEATTPERAMQIRDRLMELAAKGEKPVVEVGSVKYELARSPLMTELGGGLTHATPQGGAFTEGLTVAAKPGMSTAEQGLFVSHEPLPRFAESSAFGKTGEQPTIYITSKETAGKAVTSGKIYDSPVGKVAEMEQKFEVGLSLPAPKQILYTRIGSNGQKVVIYLEKPLNARQIIKLKAMGLIEDIKAPFKPAITISGKAEAEIVKKLKVLDSSSIEIGGGRALTKKGIGELETALRRSGRVDQARNLERAYRLITGSNLYRSPRARYTGRSEELKRLPVTERATDRQRPERIREEQARLESRLEPSRLDMARVELASEGRANRETALDSRTGRVEMERESSRAVRETDEGARSARDADRGERTGARTERAEPRTDRLAERAELSRIPGRERPQRTDTGKRLREWGENKSDTERRQFIQASTAAVTYRRGQLNGDDVWHTWVDNKGELTRVITIGPAPAGAHIVEGPRSAYETMQKLGKGLFKQPIYEDTGAVDTRITPISGQPVISFHRDVSISPRPKRVSVRGIRISPRMPRLR